MTLQHLLLRSAVAVFVLGTASLVQAQLPATGGAPPPTYDLKSETTIKGVVERVETGGVQLAAKTGTGTLQVEVGPASYLAQKKIVIMNGDAIEILGSKVMIGGKTVVIARQITRGDNVWLFRDSSGRPLWSGTGLGR